MHNFLRVFGDNKYTQQGEMGHGSIITALLLSDTN